MYLITAVTQPTHITLPNGKSSEVHTSVAAEETVDTAQTHHIMIIHEDPIDGTNTYTTQVISGEVGVHSDSLFESNFSIVAD